MNNKRETSLQRMIGRWQQTLHRNHGTFRGKVRKLLAQLQYFFGYLESWTTVKRGPTPRLVFVCLGNINRSAFGAAVAKTIGLHAVSVGLSTTTGAPATPMAIAQAAKQGYDLSEHFATDLSDYQALPGDLLLAMEVRQVRALVERGYAAQSIVLLGAWASPQRIHLHDPHTLSAAYFSTCFTLIESAVRNLAADLGSGAKPDNTDRAQE